MRGVSRVEWGERGVEKRAIRVAKVASGEGGVNGERVTRGGNCVVV